MLLLNNQPIDSFIFPGGEFQLKLPTNIVEERAVLTWKPTQPSDIMFLVLAVNALKNMGILDIDLDILYLPYARQDRICSPGQANSLEAICNILDKLSLTFIRIWDVHNEIVTRQLFKETQVIFVETANIFARYKIFEIFHHLNINNLILCAPDEGAWERVEDVANEYHQAYPVVINKVRNPHTGKIMNMQWSPHNQTIEGWNVLIIDDICDGGATFNQAAQILREQGAINLYLYVTHGIFSNGLDLLKQNFKHIICHHVLHDDKFKSHDNLTILREFTNAA